MNTPALAGTNPVLFDFDGPICSIFAGSPAADVARDLRDLAVKLGAMPGEAIGEEDDPLEILRWASRSGDASILAAVEDALVTAEIVAADSAQPAPFARDILRALHAQGRAIGIASNNSGAAINKYLDRHDLAGMVNATVGRQPYSPEAMKPDPNCLQVAMALLNVEPAVCVYIGDSIADIDAAHATGMPVIAYANKPGKFEHFIAAGADAVVRGMNEIQSAMN